MIIICWRLSYWSIWEGGAVELSTFAVCKDSVGGVPSWEFPICGVAGVAGWDWDVPPGGAYINR